MKFGTDGFRGPTDTKITPDFCLNLGFHTGCIIKDKGYDSVIIGKDTRGSKHRTLKKNRKRVKIKEAKS